MKYKELFTPVKIGSITLKNRFAMAPMGPLGLGDSEGGWNQRGIDYYVERAKGGTGLIITGVTFCDQEVEPQNQSIIPVSTHNPVHFTRTSKNCTRCYRKFRCNNVAKEFCRGTERKKSFNCKFPIYGTFHVAVLTNNFTFHVASFTNDNFPFSGKISRQNAVNSHIAVARNVTRNYCTRSD